MRARKLLSKVLQAKFPGKALPGNFANVLDPADSSRSYPWHDREESAWRNDGKSLRQPVQVRPTGACGRGRDGQPEPCGLPWCPDGHGSHGDACGQAWTVDKYVSRVVLRGRGRMPIELNGKAHPPNTKNAPRPSPWVRPGPIGRRQIRRCLWGMASGKSIGTRKKSRRIRRQHDEAGDRSRYRRGILLRGRIVRSMWGYQGVRPRQALWDLPLERSKDLHRSIAAM